MSALRSWIGSGSLYWRRIDQFRRLEIELLAIGACGLCGWMAYRF